MSTVIYYLEGRKYHQPFEDMERAHDMGLITEIQYREWLYACEHVGCDRTDLTESLFRYFGHVYDRKWAPAFGFKPEPAGRIRHGRPQIKKRQLHPKCFRERECDDIFMARKLAARRNVVQLDTFEQFDDAELGCLEPEIWEEDEVAPQPIWAQCGFDSLEAFQQYHDDVDWFYEPVQTEYMAETM